MIGPRPGEAFVGRGKIDPVESSGLFLPEGPLFSCHVNAGAARLLP